MRKVYVAFVIFLVAAAAVVFLALSSKSGGGSTTTIKDPKKIPRMVTAFVRNPYKDDYDLSRISGYVDNLTAGKVVRAHIEIQLQDKDGNRKELVKYDVTDIPAYSRKTFDANAGALGGDRRSTAKITEIEVVR